MKTKVFSVLIVVLLSTGIICAEKVQIGDLYYNLNNAELTAEVASQNDSAPYWETALMTANIPASVTYNDVTYSVTSIGQFAFCACSSLTSVTIPNSVTSIESSAFIYCSGLTSVTISSSVTNIGSSAFYNCNHLTSIDIPSNVTRIENFAFQNCDGLISITCRATNTPEMGISVFEEVDKSIPLYVPSGSIAAYQVASGWSEFTNIQAIQTEAPMFPDDPGTLVRPQIEIGIAANQWNFICLPPLGDKQYTEDMFTYDGLTNVQWGTYNGAKRAAGQAGWETPETFSALQGYILYSATAGTLRINAYEDEIRQGESGSISAPLTAYDSNHPENASWNFLGNPYSQGFSIAGLAAAGIESPITVWNGTAYSTYTPDIDDYVLQPYEAFFIQKAEGGAERITFSSEYVEDADGSGSSVADDKGTLPGYFSVSSSSKVQFSKGNLQYRASTNTWRFGNNQYDYVGSDNANISSTYDGWIDLFCWGTGNNPTLISDDTNDYSTFVDWGVNAISNGGNEANLWRTPTKAEWMYLFQSRRNASSLYGKANVNGINGVIVLPDNWQAVEGISFTSGAEEYAQNTYTIEQWRKMESAGAVFLPAAGFRDPSNSLVRSVGVSGDYWSSTLMNENGACDFYFSADYFNPQNFYSRNFVLSVRLVR